MNPPALSKLLLALSLTLTGIHSAYADELPEESNDQDLTTTKNSSLNVNYDNSEQTPLDGDNDSILDKHDQCPNSPKGNTVDKYGCTIYLKSEPKEKAVEHISLLINFENDKNNIDENGYAEISRVATFLTKYPTTSFVIEGHTSSQGDAEYNQKLSERRANEVIYILTREFAIDTNRLSAVGYGEPTLLDLTDTPEAHQINRRIEAHSFLTE